MARHAFPLQWDENDTATLPDGHRVHIHSEQVRGEPRFYYPMVDSGPNGHHEHLPHFPGRDGGSKARAKAWAQAYANSLADAR